MEIFRPDDSSYAQPCRVRWDKESIWLEYEEEGVTYVTLGAPHGEGHCELKAKGFQGRATLHPFTDPIRRPFTHARGGMVNGRKRHGRTAALKALTAYALYRSGSDSHLGKAPYERMKVTGVLSLAGLRAEPESVGSERGAQLPRWALDPEIPYLGCHFSTDPLARSSFLIKVETGAQSG